MAKSGLVQIALELKTRLFNKLLVFGLAGNRRQLAGDVEITNPLQIDVEEAVRAREQAGSLWRRVLAEGHDSATAATINKTARGMGRRRRMRIEFRRGAWLVRCEQS